MNKQLYKQRLKMDSSTDSLDFSLTSMNLSLDTSLGCVFNDQKTKKVSQDNENTTEDDDDLIDKIIACYLRHNLSLVCLEDIMKLLNIGREMCDKLPTRKREILKKFTEHKDLIQIFFFVKCGVCKKTVKIEPGSAGQVKCCNKVLKKSETNFFVYLPIKEQLVQSIENNWTYIEEFDTSSKDGCYSDAHDGEILKDILTQYESSDLNILSLCINVDGANRFKSNKFSLWPIQFTQNFLPPQIRFQRHNIIVCGLLYTDSETNLNFRDYLLPLVCEFYQMKDNHLSMSIKGSDYVFKPVITNCCVDLPAKSKIQETKQFGGYNACTYCEIPGEQVLIEKSKGGANRRGKKGSKVQKKSTECVRYVEGDEEYALRDETETLKKMLLACSEKNAVDGIKDVSCLVAFEHFNILHSVSIDYMHCVLLGVQKRILNLFLESENKNSRYYILPKKKKLLNNRIMAIKPNADIVRKPRSLEQKADFKASEYKFLLLYYLPVCLEGCIPNEFVQHIRTLSAAIYILLQTSIPSEEVVKAEIMLKAFVKEHQKLFGKQNMVMNIHLLKHLAQSVRKQGPLWCQSAFPFERNNGILLNMVRGTTDVLLQISSKYCLKKSLAKKSEKSKETSTVVKELLLGKAAIIQEKSLCVLNTETLKKLDLSNQDLCAFKRIKLGKVTYTSLLYTKPKKSIDYFVGLTNDLMGMVKFYIKLDGKMYVVLDGFETVDFIHHISKVQRTDQKILAPVADIEMKYIYMKIGLHQYVTSTPNPYENE